LALSDIITRLRILSNDTPTSNLLTVETPSGATDAVNTKFRLQQRPVVTGSVYLSFGTTFRTQTGFTVDLVNGILTITAAPAANTELKVDYNFYWFTDTDHTEFLNDAAEMLGNTDPTLVPSGLGMAMLQYALGYFWQRRASQYAHRFSSSSMGNAAQVDQVTKNFTTLAAASFKLGDNFREMYYKRQGQREAPASGTGAFAFDPYTPPK
jgi:hypothetical protein